MSKKAYRLMSNKYEQDYYDRGYDEKDTKAIIDLIYDVDEDFITKKAYIERAKYYHDKVLTHLGLDVDWKLLFGEPMESDYRYCAKCGCYFYATDGCECED